MRPFRNAHVSHPFDAGDGPHTAGSKADACARGGARLGDRNMTVTRAVQSAALPQGCQLRIARSAPFHAMRARGPAYAKAQVHQRCDTDLFGFDGDYFCLQIAPCKYSKVTLSLLSPSIRTKNEG